MPRLGREQKAHVRIPGPVLDDTRDQVADAFHLGQYGAVDVLDHPVSAMMVGGEMLRARRESEKGGPGTDSRSRLSMKYDFGATIGGE